MKFSTWYYYYKKILFDLRTCIIRHASLRRRKYVTNALKFISESLGKRDRVQRAWRKPIFDDHRSWNISVLFFGFKKKKRWPTFRVNKINFLRCSKNFHHFKSQLKIDTLCITCSTNNVILTVLWLQSIFNRFHAHACTIWISMNPQFPRFCNLTQFFPLECMCARNRIQRSPRFSRFAKWDY